MPESTVPSAECLERLHADHSRHFGANHYVYPVLSRRARGISVGLNLNPDRACNFDCVYCQVDRSTPARVEELRLDVLISELDQALDWVSSGDLYRDERFASVPASLRRLNDIAFSGDGEPTAAPEFPEAVARVAALKRGRGLDAVKLVLITNATLLHRPAVRAALEILYANQGEVWAKLDAGTESYYRAVDRSPVRFERILANLREAARQQPLIIQSLFLTLHGQGPGAAEVDAFARRLEEVVVEGGKLARVQIYTIARRPTEEWAGPLPDEALERIGNAVRARIATQVEVIPGAANGV